MLRGDDEHDLRRTRAPGLYGGHLREAGALSAPGELVGLSFSALRARGLPEAASAWLTHPDEKLLDGDRRWLERAGVELITCDSERYPPLLGQLATAPVALYVMGQPESLLSVQLAIVGSRNPSVGGVRTAHDFAAFLARAGLTITSGLALGVDAAAHEGALAAGGRTVAVLGCGLDDIYPSENRELAARTATSGGALVSEFPPG